MTASLGIPARGLPDTVTVLTAGRWTDRYGNVNVDWDTATSRTITANVQAYPGGRGDETFTERDAATLTRKMFTNDTGIGYLDRVVFEGQTYDVLGQPAVWETPDGPHHSEVELQLVEG